MDGYPHGYYGGPSELPVYDGPSDSGSSEYPPPPSPDRIFKTPAIPRRNRPIKEERAERKIRYDRIENLTQELSYAVRDEMARRKELWDVEGGREEEEFWEARKQEVYRGLEQLADEIKRAFRERRKEAVLDLWSREIEERRAGGN